MKARVRKTKDNEWIAEVLEKVMIIRGNRYMRDRHDTDPEPALCDKDGNYYYLDIKTYPIVSPSDIEWLEKNNMDGKEVEGDLKHDTWHEDNVGHVTQFIAETSFQLTTPPIHPDPAVEDWFNKADRDIVKQVFADKHLSYQKSSIEYYLKSGTVNGSFMDLILECMKKISSKQPTPQTGRVYTEGEVEDIRNEYIEREKMICRKAQEDYDKLERIKNGYQKELRELKQNPKP